MYQHYSENTGAILGDDMGLGKTVQVRTFAQCINIILSLSKVAKFSRRIVGRVACINSTMHMKVLLNGFHFNGHTQGFRPLT